MKLKQQGVLIVMLGIGMIMSPIPAKDAVDKLVEKHPGVKSADDEQARARGMFYEPIAPHPQGPLPPQPPQPPAPGQPAPAIQPAGPGQPEMPGYLGLRYKILLQGPDGQYREVSEKYPFVSGQRFRLLFQPNISGYLYIFHKGSNSKGSRLYPDPRIDGGNNFAQRFQEIMIPSSGWLRFDETPGIEDLYIFLSPTKLDRIENLQYAQDGTVAGNGWEEVTAAVSDYQYPRPDAVRGQAEKSMKEKDGKNKNIVYEPEHPPITYIPPVQEPQNWNANIPASSYALEAAPILIHHIRMEHFERR